jgi:hypothetical protein
MFGITFARGIQHSAFVRPAERAFVAGEGVTEDRDSHDRRRESLK